MILAASYTPSPHRVINRWLVLLVVALAGACDRRAQAPPQPTRQEQRKQALEYLDGSMAVIEMRSRDPRYEQEHEDLAERLDTFQRVRAWLESQAAESPIAPHPIRATLNKTPEGHYALSLSWLESDFDAHGVTLIDGAGIFGTFDHCFPKDDAATRELRKSSLLRMTVVVFTGSDGKAQDGGRPPDFHADRELRLPPLKVLIRSKNGVESAQIEAQINWATVDDRGGK